MEDNKYASVNSSLYVITFIYRQLLHTREVPSAQETGKIEPIDGLTTSHHNSSTCRSAR